MLVELQKRSHYLADIDCGVALAHWVICCLILGYIHPPIMPLCGLAGPRQMPLCKSQISLCLLLGAFAFAVPSHSLQRCTFSVPSSPSPLCALALSHGAVRYGQAASLGHIFPLSLNFLRATFTLSFDLIFSIHLEKVVENNEQHGTAAEEDGECIQRGVRYHFSCPCVSSPCSFWRFGEGRRSEVGTLKREDRW